MRAHLGYYAHHHGSGHVRRAEQVLARCRTPHTLLTSRELVDGPDVLRLPLDSGGPSVERPLPGVLHHAPIGHRGLRARTAALASWFARADPALLVVDVSVEVTLLARIAGVLPVVVRQHGTRQDPAHRAAYEAAGRILAFWPPWAEDGQVDAEVRDRTLYVGATSRLWGRALPRAVACELAGLDPAERHVVVLRGFGGDAFTHERLLDAARATPDHRWTVIGAPPADVRVGRPDDLLDVRGVVDDPVTLLSAADVVVTHGGQNAIADAAAVGARLVVLPQQRPFDEQHLLAGVLSSEGCAIVPPGWPDARAWPGVLEATETVDRDRLRTYVSDGAGRAASELDRLVARVLEEADPPPEFATLRGDTTPPAPQRPVRSPERTGSHRGGEDPEEESPTVRVASVPFRHVYVRRLWHPRIERLMDPSGDDLRTPSYFDPAWLRANAGSFDVLHVNFGFEFYAVDQLEAVCDELERQRVPIVYTCHDLRNPNHATPDVHDAGLDVWLRRATRIVTLTPWAARRIAERSGRRAVVLPHPHVVPIDELRRRARAPRGEHRDRHRIGLHLKSMRANMIGAPLLAAVLDAIETLDGVRLRLDLHHDLLDPDSRVHDPQLAELALRTIADAASPADLHVHGYASDDELWQLIASVDSFILPYRFGTHSGLLEACKDLGTAVIAPTCGAYADQGAQHLFRSGAAGLDRDSVRTAIGAAVAAGRPDAVPVERRDRERREVAAGYAALFREALAATRGESVA